MKFLRIIASITILLTGVIHVASSQNVSFSDTKFLYALTDSDCADFDGDGIFESSADLNNDGNIQVSEALLVKGLNVNSANIDTLDGIQAFENLTFLDCSVNEISGLDVSNMVHLLKLICNRNTLTAINMQGALNLKTLDCALNNLTGLDFEAIPAIEFLRIDHNYFDTLELHNFTSLAFLSCGSNFSLSHLSLENLPAIKNLVVDFCDLTYLDLQPFTTLERVSCTYNELSGINLGGLINLEYCYCYHNQLNALDLSGLVRLKELDCSENQISTLDFQGLSALEYIICNDNLIAALDLHEQTELDELDCSHNFLTVLDLYNLPKITALNCSYNQLVTLDLQQQFLLFELNCSNNQLPSLFIKNGSIEVGWALNFSANPLIYICCDEAQLFHVRNKAAQNGYTNCIVNTYCTFNPGGDFYTLSGANSIDISGNGCDAGDPFYPGVKYKIANGTTTGTFIADQLGIYQMELQAGTHTIIPQFENPGFFQVFPDTLFLTLPSGPDSIVQDFCITPVGLHHDVELVVLPPNNAIPGFTGFYQIVCKNKGNQVESGAIDFVFNNNLMDFVSASQTPDEIVGDTLRWFFNNLAPLHTSSIQVSFLLNSPLDTVQLFAGDTLCFWGNVVLDSLDETIADNHFLLKQVVIGSFDPNDKTCLEGDQIFPEMVGDYLHYLIRFENTGTYFAQNIVVQDIIDVNKFDINSLQIVSSSHTCYARIVSNNQVEFVFEDIYLPFTDPDKYGFVAFKIKTQNNLTLGASISNKASIYFDYNLPVITNNTITKVVPDCSNLPPVSGFFTVTPTTCGASNGAVLYSGPGSCMWSGGLVGNNPAGIVPGTFEVTVTSPEGCTTMETIVIDASSALAATITAINPNNGEGNGAITVDPGGPGYTYTWEPDILSGYAPQGLFPGNYTVTITDTATGCSAVAAATLTNVTGIFTVGLPQVSVLVLPNPTTGGVYLAGELEFDYVDIIDVYGRVIAQNNVRQQQVDLAGFPPGTYYLKLYNTTCYALEKVIKE